MKQERALFEFEVAEDYYQNGSAVGKEMEFSIKVSEASLLNCKYYSEYMEWILTLGYLESRYKHKGFVGKISTNFKEHTITFQPATTEDLQKLGTTEEQAAAVKAITEETHAASTYIAKNLQRAIILAINKLMQEAVTHAGVELCKKNSDEKVTSEEILRPLKDLQLAEMQITKKSVGLPTAGRPSRHTKVKIEQMLRKAIKGFRKRKYRNPTLTEAVEEISKTREMSLANMKQILHRYELRYSTYTKET